MFQAILIIVFLALAVGSYWLSRQVDETSEVQPWVFKWVGTGVFATLAVVLFIGLSVVYVDKDEIMLKDRIYGGSNMPTGQIIANSDQNGPQAEVINPGFHFIPFVRFVYDLEAALVTTVQPNTYAKVTAIDGKALAEGQVIASAWDNVNDMINAEKFLAEGGQKGMQLTVLPPGQYRINTYLFNVEYNNAALQVKTGEVAVIRSNVTEREGCKTEVTEEGLTTALVPKGCKGVWNEPLYQGMYFLNSNAYKPTIISTRAQVWAYKGGYTTSKIDLTVMDNGSITQVKSPITVEVPENAADKAINVRSEGWTVPVEARVTVQVSPEDAPRVVAGVGSLQNVEDKITTPNIRDSLRTIGGRSASGCVKGKCKDSGAKVLDFVTKRAEIAKKVLADIVPSTQQAGVTILEVNLGEPAIPPELLLADQRNQLAQQLKKTYETEKQAQRLRIAVEKEKATANQQAELVKADIAQQASLKYMAKRKNEGRGEKDYLLQLAEGEKARKDVLGEAAVVQLKLMEMIAAQPELIKVPHIVVGSQGGSSLEGMAAILGGYSNVAKVMAPAAK